MVMTKQLKTKQVSLAAIPILLLAMTHSLYMLATIPPHSATIIGISMYPTLQANDKIYGYTPKRFEDLKVGDIVAFEYQDGYICHRIIEIHTLQYIVVKGDNVQETQVIGFYDIIFVVNKVVRPNTLEYLYYENLRFFVFLQTMLIAVFLLGIKGRK